MRLYLVVLTGLRLEDSVFFAKHVRYPTPGECLEVRSWGLCFCFNMFSSTLFETSSSYLKIDGSNTTFLLGPAYFQGRFAVSFREGNILWPSPICGWQFLHNRRSPPLTRTRQHGMVLGPFCLQRAEDFWSFEPWTWWPMQREMCNNVGAMVFWGN